MQTRKESKKELPIPLTCTPDIRDGTCSHGLEGGSCDLPDQFMCPFFLWYVKQPENAAESSGDVSIPLLNRVRAEVPVSASDVLNTGKKKAKR